MEYKGEEEEAEEGEGEGEGDGTRRCTGASLVNSRDLDGNTPFLLTVKEICSRPPSSSGGSDISEREQAEQEGGGVPSPRRHDLVLELLLEFLACW